jgi:RNA polymerase sigma-70 factor (ECF subfamily)
VEAFERGDTKAVVALLADDAWLTMPPYPFEYQGKERPSRYSSSIGGRARDPRRRVVPTRANG